MVSNWQNNAFLHSLQSGQTMKIATFEEFKTFIYTFVFQENEIKEGDPSDKGAKWTGKAGSSS